SLEGRSKESLIILLKAKGYLEPFEIVEIEHDKPSSEQLKYAESLNIKIPPNATKVDVSCLISRVIDNDNKEPNRELIDFAEENGLFFSRYIGKKALYNLIYHNLSEIDKIAFFVFSVYRYLSGDRMSNLRKHPNKNRFYEIAHLIQDKDQIKKSILRYEGQDLRFFGVITLSNGNEIYGGSIGTYGYKFVADIISEEFKTKKTKTLDFETTNNELNQSKKSCFSTLALIIIAINTIIYFWFLKI
ncbi:MAG: hypothetical protein MRY83_08465, partial [Flavobacteriales bacterium]|nr:hypothetical protein [Flavobacteriales bacterium]